MWEIVETGVYIHVIPTNDIEPHVESVACKCRPEAEKYERWLIVHNAFDGRESQEEEDGEE